MVSYVLMMLFCFKEWSRIRFSFAFLFKKLQNWELINTILLKRNQYYTDGALRFQKKNCPIGLWQKNRQLLSRCETRNIAVSPLYGFWPQRKSVIPIKLTNSEAFSRTKGPFSAMLFSRGCSAGKLIFDFSFFFWQNPKFLFFFAMEKRVRVNFGEFIS